MRQITTTLLSFCFSLTLVSIKVHGAENYKSETATATEKVYSVETPKPQISKATSAEELPTTTEKKETAESNDRAPATCRMCEKF
jgi:hypothetical protein